MFNRLHHVAYRCRDAQRTVEFYTNVVGLEYAAGLLSEHPARGGYWPLNEPGKPPRKVLRAAKARLEAHGVQVLGPKDHIICQSIYFMDPDGNRLEMVVRTEKPGIWQQLADEAPGKLAEWNARKQRLYGRAPEPLPSAIPAMPADSTTVVPA